MPFKKRVLAILSLTILIAISAASKANTRWNLLEGIDPNPADFKEREIGKKIVYWKRRMVGEVRVQKDKIIYQFDRETQELIDVIVRWRDDLPPFLTEVNITKERAESMVEGTVQLSRLYILSPQSVVFSPIKPTPENPCWVVASVDDAKRLITTVIDAVEGTVLGYAIPPPYTGFSLRGSYDEFPFPCTPCELWKIFTDNATEWFEEMDYPTEQIAIPTEEQVKAHIRSKTTAMFYEMAHSLGEPNQFASGCDHDFFEITYASEIEDWIGDYTKMPFTFLASCSAMCDTNDNTLSYEFRKGSMEDTATVGCCGMADPNTCLATCWWEDAFDWQDKLFECMSQGYTVKEAFDIADACCPDCADNECMRFAGDPNFAVVPVVWRVAPPLFDLEKADDVNDGSSVLPDDEITYTIIYGPNGHDHNNVVITDYLPLEVTYEYIDWSTFTSDPNYDPNNRTYKWEIGPLDANDPNDSVTLTVKVNQLAEPLGKITNVCEIESDIAYNIVTEQTDVNSWDPGVIYVDRWATGSNTGMSWYHAYTDLQSALERAQQGCGNEIWVAEGTYKPTKESARSISFELLDDVAIYGGFAGTESHPSQRNLTDPNNETILSGDIGTPDDQTDNSYHVVKCQDVNNAILDGFTITDGNANGSDTNAWGGGIYCRDSNNLTVTNCMFSGNSADYGGGVLNYSSDPNITNCTFSNNSAYEGGGAYNYSSSDPNIINCTLTNNTAVFYGGGMVNSYESSPTITNCTFSGNSTTATSTYYAYGGGAICNWIDSDPNVTNCTFSNNSASHGGGLFNNSSDPNITNCIFSGNTADATTSNSTGGGMSNFHSSPTITNCIFSGNATTATSPYYYSYGGGIHDTNSFPMVTNCIFSGNSAGYGGGTQNWQSSPTVTNCTFSGNLAYCGGGMDNEDNSDPNVTNCIFWGNNADCDGNEIYNYDDNSDPNFRYCDIEGCGGSEGWDPNFGSNGGGNIDEDPCFVNPDANDYHLGSNSPCIDAGTNTPIGGLPTTDIDGEDRVIDGDGDGNSIVDMGADEYYWSPADFDEDEMVNFIDYAILASAWQSEPNDDNYNEDCDLEDNNSIDYDDLALFCKDWLWEVAWDDSQWWMMMGRGMGQGFGLMEGLYPYAPAEQQPTEIKPLDIEEIIKWLDELWLTDEQVRKMISEDEWLKFIESVGDSK